MVFDFLEKTARAAVDVACDTGEMLVGGDAPKKEDVATLLAAGLSVWAVAEIVGIGVDVVEELAGKGGP